MFRKVSISKVTLMKPNTLLSIVAAVVATIYFISYMLNMDPLVKVITSFPAIFVMPGLLFLLILKGKGQRCGGVQLIVEAFFFSNVFDSTIMSLFILLGVPLNPLFLSTFYTCLIFILIVICYTRKPFGIYFTKYDRLALSISLLTYVITVVLFAALPRYLTPDETSYIFYARKIILDGEALPMGVSPARGEMSAFLNSRYLWAYLIATFLGSAGLQPYSANLIGPAFLSMTALASTLLIPEGIKKSKELRLVTLLTVATNPLLVLFSGFVLSDLAIAFYVLFAVVFFVKSFNMANNEVSISFGNLTTSLIAIVVVSLIKKNIVVFFGMWLVLVYVLLRYRLYKLKRSYKILLLLTVVTPIVYELALDIPYVIATWFLRNSYITQITGQFILVSPLETLLSIFISPWWAPTSKTIFSSIDYLGYLYTLLTPETLGPIISATLLLLPLAFFSKQIRKEMQLRVLTLLVLISFSTFFFLSLLEVSVGTVPRVSVWLIPMSVPLCLVMLFTLISNRAYWKLCSIQVVMLLLLWINLKVVGEYGGVFVGYGVPGLTWTYKILIIHLIFFTVLVSIIHSEVNVHFRIKIGHIRRFLSALGPKWTDSRAKIFYTLIVLTVVNGLYVSSFLIQNSLSFEDHGLVNINNAIDKTTQPDNIIIANNFIYLRDYVSDGVFRSGLLLPPPSTIEEFSDLLRVAPNNTMLVISTDRYISSYEYANEFTHGFASSQGIILGSPTSESFPKSNLTDLVLSLSFDEINGMKVEDQSGCENDGVIHGARLIQGYYGRALGFDGESYVSIPSNDTLNLQNEITIEFLGFIERAEPLRGYTILSKGYSPFNGSYMVNIWDEKLYFGLGGVDSISVPINQYLGNWHYFTFTYDGETMSIYIDLLQVASKPAKGFIRSSQFDLEIGRNSELKAYYFVGSIDELQISRHALNITCLAKAHHSKYAIRTDEISLPFGNTTVFKVVDSKGNHEEIKLTIKSAEIEMDGNSSIVFKMRIFSSRPENVSILIGTDRFTKVFIVPLLKGDNDIDLTFKYEPPDGGMYWRHLGAARILIIDSTGALVYNEFVSRLNIKTINYIFTILMSILLCLLIISHRRP